MRIKNIATEDNRMEERKWQKQFGEKYIYIEREEIFFVLYSYGG